MLNMIDTQDKLKNFSQEQLIREMQMPTGSAPQFMVLSEIERRKRMRADAQRQEGLMQPTVAQEAVSAAGVPQQGIAQVAQAMAPKTDMTQNTGVPSVQASKLPGQPNQPQRMADGGIMRLAPGGSMSGGTLNAIASLKVTHPDVYNAYKDEPDKLAKMAKAFLEVADDPEMTRLEELEAPRTGFKTSNFKDNVSGGLRTYLQEQRDAEEFGEGYALDQRRQSLNTSRPLSEDDPLFAEGSVVERIPYGAYDATVDGTSTGRYNFVNDLPDDALDFGGAKEPSPFGRREAAEDAAREKTFAASEKRKAEEKARRAYLAGGDYNESDVPAIVDMLNRGREFQQSDTYTPPEQIYTDLGANSPLAGLKYTMDGTSEDDQAEMFSQYADRLAIERRIAEDIKEQEAFARAENARRIAGDAMDEDVAMEQGLEGPSFLQRLSGAIDETIGSEDPAVKFNKMLYEKNKAEADAKAANIASTLDNENRLQKRQLTGLETITAAQRRKDEAAKAAAKKLIADAGGKDDGKQTFKSTAENMNQDKWLALAQAGLTLMSTGDFGKAGSAGLAALRESKKSDLAERKLAADERLTDARIAAANKKTSTVKAPPAAMLTFAQSQVESAQDALAQATSDENKSAMLTAQTKLNEAIAFRDDLMNRYRYVSGMGFTGGSSSGIDEYDLTSKAG
jgi:hypothetical protein